MSRESDYLDLQAKNAKAGLRRTARALSDELLEPLRIRPFIRSRPWWSLGGAAVAGFVSGARSGRPGAKPAVAPGVGVLSGLFAGVDQRVRRVLRSIFGAVLVANMRGEPPVAGPGAGESSSPT